MNCGEINHTMTLGTQMKTVHLVGTGAGVPFIYYIGKSIQIEGIPSPGRITAIDAGPGFEYPEWTRDFKSLANYTEAIHTSISYHGDTRPGRYVGYSIFKPERFKYLLLFDILQYIIVFEIRVP